MESVSSFCVFFTVRPVEELGVAYFCNKKVCGDQKNLDVFSLETRPGFINSCYMPNYFLQFYII